jgi:hypothetical protein
VADNADDLLITSQITPNTPGQRFLVVRVDDTRRPAPAPVTGVVASLDDGADVAMVHGNDGLWTASVGIPRAGPLLVHVAVSRPSMPVAVVATQWTVAPIPGTQAGGPTLTRFVALAITGLVVSWLLLLLLEHALGTRRREGATDAESAADELSEPVSV